MLDPRHRGASMAKEELPPRNGAKRRYGTAGRTGEGRGGVDDLSCICCIIGVSRAGVALRMLSAASLYVWQVDLLRRGC